VFVGAARVAPIRTISRYQTDIAASNPRAGGGTRTHDLLITNQLLYQLSYSGAPKS
jgi:hypothetical protein